jgi:hypothetical protein
VGGGENEAHPDGQQSNGPGVVSLASSCPQAACHLLSITDGVSPLLPGPWKVLFMVPAQVLTVSAVGTPPTWAASPHCPVPRGRPGFWGSSPIKYRKAKRCVSVQPCSTMGKGLGLLLWSFSKGLVTFPPLGLNFSKCKVRMMLESRLESRQKEQALCLSLFCPPQRPLILLPHSHSLHLPEPPGTYFPSACLCQILPWSSPFLRMSGCHSFSFLPGRQPRL